MVFLDFAFELDQVFYLLQKPDVNFSFLDDGLEGNPEFNGIVNMEQTVPARKF